MSLNDGFHDLYNKPVDRLFTKKRIGISSTQRLLKVLKKQRDSILSNTQQRMPLKLIRPELIIPNEIIYEVRQGSILGLLLFNIYICDIFFDIIECDIASYADDNTPYNFDFNHSTI